MKKGNAVLALLTIAAMLVHTELMSYSLMTGWYDYISCMIVGEVALLLLTLHASMSLIIVFFRHDGSDLTGSWRFNIKTIIQRGTGLLLILMVHLHMGAYEFIAAREVLDASGAISRIVMEVVFAACLLAHIATSFSKALITLGLVASEKTVRRIDTITTVAVIVLGATFVYSVVHFFAEWIL